MKDAHVHYALLKLLKVTDYRNFSSGIAELLWLNPPKSMYTGLNRLFTIARELSSVSFPFQELHKQVSMVLPIDVYIRNTQIYYWNYLTAFSSITKFKFGNLKIQLKLTITIEMSKKEIHEILHPHNILRFELQFQKFRNWPWKKC